MDMTLLFPGKYLKSAEFKGQRVTLTITGIALEELVSQKGSETKGVVAFGESKKLWVLNRTNAECLKAMWGRETDKWIGKRVTLYPEPYTDPQSGEKTTAIRVFGSPDLASNVTAVIALARKKPFQKLLQKVGPATNGKTAGGQAEPPPLTDADMPAEEALP